MIKDIKQYDDGTNLYETNGETTLDFAKRKKTRWERRFFPNYVEEGLEYSTGHIVVSNVENGKIECSKTSGNVGDEITVTATADEGYQLATLTANEVDILSTKKFSLVGGENVVAGTFSAVEVEGE